MIPRLLLRELRFARRERPVLIGYLIMLILMGVLQPIASLGEGNAPGPFAGTGIFTLSAFLLFLALGHSNQSFIVEKSSNILGTVLSCPIRIWQMIIAKWLFGWVLVIILALLILALQTGILFWGQTQVPGSAPWVFEGAIVARLAVMPLCWALAGWSGAYIWLKFDTFPSANISSLLVYLPIVAAQYLILEGLIPLWSAAAALVLLNLLAAFGAIRLNTRDRLAQLT